jgi:hypothetical protein
MKNIWRFILAFIEDLLKLDFFKLDGIYFYNLNV